MQMQDLSTTSLTAQKSSGGWSGTYLCGGAHRLPILTGLRAAQVSRASDGLVVVAHRGCIARSRGCAPTALARPVLVDPATRHSGLSAILGKREKPKWARVFLFHRFHISRAQAALISFWRTRNIGVWVDYSLRQKPSSSSYHILSPTTAIDALT